VIYKLRELKGVEDLGGTMRLGGWPCKLAEGSLAYRAYGTAGINERIATATSSTAITKPVLTSAGLRITGVTPDNTYVEICELGDHPMVPGLPVPSRVQVQADGAASPVQGLRGRGLRAPPEAPANFLGGGLGVGLLPCPLTFPHFKRAGRWYSSPVRA